MCWPRTPTTYFQHLLKISFGEITFIQLHFSVKFKHTILWKGVTQLFGVLYIEGVLARASSCTECSQLNYSYLGVSFNLPNRQVKTYLTDCTDWCTLHRFDAIVTREWTCRVCMVGRGRWGQREVPEKCSSFIPNLCECFYVLNTQSFILEFLDPYILGCTCSYFTT